MSGWVSEIVHIPEITRHETRHDGVGKGNGVPEGIWHRKLGPDRVFGSGDEDREAVAGRDDPAANLGVDQALTAYSGLSDEVDLQRCEVDFGLCWSQLLGYQTEGHGLVAGESGWMRQPGRHLDRRRRRGKRRGRRRLEARGSIHGRRWPTRPATAKEGRPLFLVRRRSGTFWVESEGAAGVGLLVRLGRSGGLDGQKLEAHLVAPVLFEQAGPLDGDLDVVADLGLARKSRKARGQGLGDVLVQQLLGPVHDAEANTKGAAGADHAADPRHGLGVAAGVVEGELELKGEAVLSRVEDVRGGGDRGALVGEDLADLVEDLVVLVQGVPG